MFLSIDETSEILGLSAKWVRERVESGDAVLSRHIRCRRVSKSPKRTDRSPIRIWSRDLAAYILLNRRDHAWAEFRKSEDEIPEAELERVERFIWSFLQWTRSGVTEPEINADLKVEGE